MNHKDVGKVLSMVTVALHPRNVLMRGHWHPMRLETVKRISQVRREINAEEKAREEKSDVVVAREKEEGEKPPKMPAWHGEYYDLRNEKTGKPYDNLTIALGFLIATMESREVVGGESGEMTEFWHLAEILENRLTDSEEMLSRPQVNPIAVKSFRRQLDGVFFAGNRLFSRHEGDVRHRKTAIQIVNEGIKKLPKQKQKQALDIMAIAAVEQEEVDALGKKDVLNLLVAIEKPKGSGEPGQEAEDE